MKKAKSKAIDITTMQPVKLKSAKKEKKPLSNQPDYLNALSKAQKMPKSKTNFSTEKFVNVEDGKSFKKPVASLYIEVYQNNAVSIKGGGSKNHIREAIVKIMLESDSYFELFMECAAIAMIDKAEKMATKTSKKKSTPKKFEAVSKKPAKKK